MSADSFKARLSAIQLVECLRSYFLYSTQALFYLFPVHPVLLHIFYDTQLFSARGAMVLSIELAPFLEEEPLPNSFAHGCKHGDDRFNIVGVHMRIWFGEGLSILQCGI